MTDLAKLVVKLEAQTAQYMQQLDAANRKLDKFAKSADISAKNIAVGVAAAASGAAIAFGAMANEAVKHADRLDEMSQSTGISVTALSQLEYAAQFSSVAVEDLVKSAAKLTKGMVMAAEAGADSDDAFKKLGISIKNNDGTLRKTDDVLLDVAERFAGMEDGTTKSALALELFGKSGLSMIPFLNEGRDGIAALTAEADAFGVTISDDTAARAAIFNDNLDKLKSAATGMTNKFLEAALPTMIAVSQAFLESAKSGGTLNAAIGVLGATFKAFVSAGVIVKSVFQTLGRVIYGVGAALVRVANGEFKLAAQEIRDAFDDSVANVTDDMEMIGKVWSDQIPEMEVTAKKIDRALENTIVFNPKKAEDKAQKAADAAVTKLRDMAKTIEDQIATYGMAEGAVIRYRLAHGDLAAVVAKSGEAGKAYAADLIAQTDALEMLEMQQEQVAASAEALKSRQEEAKKVVEDMRTPMEAYVLQIKKLYDMYAQGDIAYETYKRAVFSAQEALETATRKSNAFLEEATRQTQTIIADGITSVIEDGVKKGAKGALRAFGDMLQQMAVQALAADIGKRIFGSGGIGGGGGWLGAAANFAGKIFGGIRDSGGRGQAGHAYMIGTGAQPEMFVPDTAGTFIPADAMGGKTEVNFHISAPDGRISRETQQQVATRTLQAMQLARRRNG